jgi:hypothetical protein
MSTLPPDALDAAIPSQLLPSQQTILREMQEAYNVITEARTIQFTQQPPATFTELPHEAFMQHMQAMHQYYTREPATPMEPVADYPLPLALIHPPLLSPPPVSPGALSNSATLVVAPQGVSMMLASSKAVDDVLLHNHKVTIACIHAYAEGIIAAAASLAKTHTTAQFTSQMHALRKKAKADHNARIDALYHRFTKLGKVYPAQRPRMLHATNRLGAFSRGLVASGEGVAQKVMRVVAGPAKTVVAQVRPWAAKAAHDIGSVIKKLF